ncbi:hypothetical protein NQ318_004237 [Aromia moschata]|uniref:GIY-YIG domain-containing protein n=1 Tax=Aromia moschata TaxID=1265417 RepID=A0AAV8Y4K0_9CUCU|nr:hypothetical protein NQ318_004237 [Aromia moschata]
MRVWFRYVDDIFAVFDTKAISLDNFVAKLNNRFPTIKFTYEVEHNEQLPFLDVLVIRNSENKLEFDVYRKETATLRYIPNDSHHPFQHKMTLLGNPKDKINNNEKSGIYEISCKDCDQKYIGQTKRSILTRFKEHMAHLKYGRTEKSCVAQHAFDNNHRIDINNLKLIRNVTNSGQLDAFESLEIIKCNNSMNKDNGPIPTSPLFALINKDSYGSVNRGNKFGINSANV